MRQTKQDRALVFNAMRKAELLAKQRGYIPSVTDSGTSQTLHVWNKGVLVLASELSKEGACFSRVYDTDGATIKQTLTCGPDSAVALLGWAYTA